MNISDKYQNRHGLADFNQLTFNITNKKDTTTVNCTLLPIPEYTTEYTYRERICEGNGWTSPGEMITKIIIHNGYYIVILDNECLGYINSKTKPTLSTKYPILKLDGMLEIKKFIKII